jgi:hypothetical protein
LLGYGAFDVAPAGGVIRVPPGGKVQTA